MACHATSMQPPLKVPLAATTASSKERKKASFGLGLSRLATELQLLTLLKRRKTYFHIDRDRGETGFLLFVDDVDEASFKS